MLKYIQIENRYFKQWKYFKLYCFAVGLLWIKSLQAFWAEETSLKNIKILMFKNFWLVVYRQV